MSSGSRPLGPVRHKLQAFLENSLGEILNQTDADVELSRYYQFKFTRGAILHQAATIVHGIGIEACVVVLAQPDLVVRFAGSASKLPSHVRSQETAQARVPFC
jgi:hypothetical protein